MKKLSEVCIKFPGGLEVLLVKFLARIKDKTKQQHLQQNKMTLHFANYERYSEKQEEERVNNEFSNCNLLQKLVVAKKDSQQR